jgi:hypothetical protein
LTYQTSLEAAEEIHQITQWLACNRNMQAVENFLQAFFEHMILIDASPGIGLTISEGVFKTGFLRGKYQIFYRLEANVIMILQVYPSARNPLSLRYPQSRQ